MATTILKQTANKEWLVYFINAFLIVQFLCFIDEGYYDFRWMKSIGNWIVFSLYTAVIFSFQWFVAFVVFERIFNIRKRLFGIVFGTIFLILLLVFSLFTNSSF